MKTSRGTTVVGLFTLALCSAWACSSRVADHSSETNGQRLGPAENTNGSGVADPGTYTTMLFAVAGGDGVCIPLAVPTTANGQNDCTVIEMKLGNHCDCTEPGRRPATEAQVAAGRRDLARKLELGCDQPGMPACSSFCGCELQQMTGSALDSCRQDEVMHPDAVGWCYLDPLNGLGNPALVAPGTGCGAPEDKLIRAQAPHLTDVDGSGMVLRHTVMACAVELPAAAAPPPGEGKVGAACLPTQLSPSGFVPFERDQASIDTASPDCATGLCLANNITFHYDASNPNRLSDSEVYCSCRCDGPAGAGPFCACPSGFECTPFMADVGLASTKAVAGSYCMKTAP